MAGRSHEELIEIRKEDAHQVFVHAEMLRNGQRFQAIREIPVQPLERWLAVTPKTEIDAAGQVARTLIRVADAAGNPVANAPVSINSWNQSLESRFWPWVFSQRLNQKMAWKPCLRHWAASTNSMLKPPCLGSSGPDCGLDRLALPPASRGAFVRLVDGIMPRPGVDAAERQGIGSYYLFRFNSGSEAPLLPEDFPVWKTGLATDAEGKVMVEWPLPQKPGTWRLRVSCQAAGRRFGDAEETFRLPGNPPAAAAGGK